MAAGTLLGHERRLRPPLHPQLGEDRAHVVLDRLLREIHRIRDLAVGLALGDQAQDAPLLLRQLGERVPVPPAASSRMRCSTLLVTEGSSSDSPRATASMALTNSRPRVCLSR